MSEPLAVGCLGLALALAGRRRSTPVTGSTSSAGGTRIMTRARLAAASLGLAGALLIGGPLGAAVGVAAFLGTERAIRSLEPAAVRRRKEQRAAELPLVLDLLAVCLRAGAPLVIALETVAEALPSRFSRDLELVAGLQRLGCRPPSSALPWTGGRRWRRTARRGLAGPGCSPWRRSASASYPPSSASGSSRSCCRSPRR